MHGYQVEIDPDTDRKRMWSAGIFEEARADQKDSQTIEFTVLLQADAQKTITNTAHYSW